MTLLVMSNWNLQTGYAVFTLYGYQDDVLIFEVSNDQWGKAQVTLKGPYENYEYIPNFGSAVPDIDVDGELSRAYSRVTTG
jgi:hypothetical protein